MKFLFDILPIFIFFAVFKFFGIYWATGSAIAASIIQIGTLLFLRKRVEPMQWVSLIIIFIFGGLTLFLHNELFIKWKPSVLYGLFAGYLSVSFFVFKKNSIRFLLGSAVELPERAWHFMNISWMFFFAFLAVLNGVVATLYSTETWVNFKVFGLIGLTVLFVIIQSAWIARLGGLGQEKS